MKLRYPLIALLAIPLLYLAHQKVEERLWIESHNDHCEPYSRLERKPCLIIHRVEK